MQNIILVIHIILAFLITGLVLLQKSEGGALGALSGSGANGFLTARQAGNLLTKLTSYLFAAFICTSLTLIIMANRTEKAEPVSLVPTTTQQQPAE